MEQLDKQRITKTVKDLVKIASKIDNSNPTVAAEIDKISESYLGIMKEAQYVGVQGYALRNRRCFDNCLRQKRAKSNKPYDEIWGECHKEYTAALDSDGSDTWNKYASKEDKNIRNIPAELIKTADSLLDLSEKLESEDAEELIKVANEMIKEAQLWDTIKNVGKNIKNRMSPVFYQIRKVLDELHRSINTQINAVQVSEGNPKALMHAGRNTLKTLQQYSNEIATNTAFNGLGKAGQEMRKDISGKISQLVGRFQNIKDINQIEPTMSDSLNVVKGLSQNIFSQEKTNDLGEIDVDADGVADSQDIDNNNNGVRDEQEGVIGNVGNNASKVVSTLKEQLSQLGQDPESQQAIASALMTQFGMDFNSARWISERLTPTAKRVAKNEVKQTKISKRKRII